MGEYSQIPQQIVGASPSNWKVFCILSVGFSVIGQVMLQYTQYYKWEMILMAYSGYFVAILCLIVFSWIKMCCKLKIFPRIHHSTLYSADLQGDEIRLVLVKGVWSSVFAGVFNFIGYFGLFYVLSLDHYKGLGIVGVILVVTPIFIMILNRLFFNQRLTAAQLTGVILILCGTQLYSIQYDIKASQNKVIGSCACLLAYILKGILNKHAAKHQFDEHTAATLGGFVQSLIGLACLATIYFSKEVRLFFDGTQDIQLQLLEIGITSAAGVCFCLAAYFFTKSMMEGNTAVSFAVFSVQVLGCTCTSNYHYTCPQINGIVVALSAVICFIGIAFALFINRICNRCEERGDVNVNSERDLREQLLNAGTDMESNQ